MPILQTLPNIDINIKCGNSLISRFPLDADLSKALKSIKYNINTYRKCVADYKNATNKDDKRSLDILINQIKIDFKDEIHKNDPKYIRLNKVKGELWGLTNQVQIFEQSKEQKQEQNKKLEKLAIEQTKLEQEISEIQNNIIYRNAFEWRFEFPEVLDDSGNFLGFDVVIGNPPYVFGGNEGIPVSHKEFFKQKFKSGTGKINLFTLFIEQSFNLIKRYGKFSFIIPNTFLRVTSYHESRKLLVENHKILTIYDFGNYVFDDAITTAIVLVAEKAKSYNEHVISINNNGTLNRIQQIDIAESNFVISLNIDSHKKDIISKLFQNSYKLGELCQEMIFGVVITNNKGELVSNNPESGWLPFIEGRDIGAYYIKPIHSWINYDPKLLHRARSKEIFEAKEKILVQRITGGSQPIKAAYDNQQLYNKESINNIILNDNCKLSAKYILALLNSRVVNWFYTNQFTNESKLTVNLSKEYLSQIPIPIPTVEKHSELITLVEKILKIKEADYNLDTTQTERTIDSLVYDLFGLNTDEIKIIENAFS